MLSGFKDTIWIILVTSEANHISGQLDKLRQGLPLIVIDGLETQNIRVTNILVCIRQSPGDLCP